MIELIITPIIETKPVISATITTASNLEATSVNFIIPLIIILYSNLSSHSEIPHIAAIRINPKKMFNFGCLSANETSLFFKCIPPYTLFTF